MIAEQIVSEEGIEALERPSLFWIETAPAEDMTDNLSCQVILDFSPAASLPLAEQLAGEEQGCFPLLLPHHALAWIY